MVIRGRTLLAAIMASSALLLFSAEAFPSYNTEAGQKLSVARERLADLKRSPKKRKYRSYWMDTIRTFELVEKKYPDSPSASDACFERATVYLDLYRFNQYSRDFSEASMIFGACQASYPRHARAPEALYRVVMIARGQKKDRSTVMDLYKKLAEAYPDSAWTAKAKVWLGIRHENGNGKKTGRATEIRKAPGAVLAAPRPPKELGTVSNVRYWSGGAYTRIVIDLDRPLKFQTHELKDPDRLVFDILNSRASDSVEKDPLPVNDGILRQVRSSQNSPDTVRVVLDLASLKSYAAFPLHEPERLVIDVTGSAGDDEPENGAAAPPAKSEPEMPTLPPQHTASPPVARPKPDPNADPKLSLSRQLGLKVKTIAIDAGHGGKDPGALGRSGLKEKTITLDVAKRLAVLVKERLGCEVVMTRDRDVFIELEQRPFIAKSKGADLFVSIHVNANRKRKARGIETYIQSLRASDRDAMATAAFENATSTKTLSQLGNELDRILKDLRTDDKQEESLQLAHAVQASLVGNVKPVKGHIVNLGVKRAFFYVLINTEMPSILAEVGFISNPDEEKMLKKDEYRQDIAEALFEGVKKYVESRGQQVAGI
ncbi:MAG: N-acetylmuramoyl-L-alanine amidase [Nitrospirota bacterium]